LLNIIYCFFQDVCQDSKPMLDPDKI